MKSKISNLDKEQFEHGPMSESTIVDNIQALVTYRLEQAEEPIWIAANSFSVVPKAGFDR